MDIQISLKDWKRIDDAGFIDAPLFEYPNQTSTHIGELEQFPVKFLKDGPKAVLFYNIGQAEEAKEELLKSLVTIRAAIEAQKEGRRETSIEI